MFNQCNTVKKCQHCNVEGDFVYDRLRPLSEFYETVENEGRARYRQRCERCGRYSGGTAELTDVKLKLEVS